MTDTTSIHHINLDIDIDVDIDIDRYMRI